MRNVNGRFQIFMSGQKELVTSFDTFEKAFDYFCEALKLWPSNRIKIFDKVEKTEWKNNVILQGYRFQVYNQHNEFVTSYPTFEESALYASEAMQKDLNFKFSIVDKEGKVKTYCSYK